MSGLASLFPPPPNYYKQYTAEYKSNPDLEPPPIPSDRPTYRNFGSIWNVQNTLPSLSDSEVQQLYPPQTESSTESIINELRKLNKSVLYKYINLVHTLQANPEMFPQSVEQLQTLFVNMHHLLNTFRQQQSKAALAELMTAQIEAKTQSTEHVRETVDKIRSSIKTLQTNLQLTKGQTH